jgi:hypothetical protein
MALLLTLACGMADAEIVIPNPLIKPALNSRLTQADDNALRAGRAQPGEAMALPYLPSMPGASATAGATSASSTTPKGDDLLGALAQYHVVFLNDAAALLKWPVKPGVPGSDQGASGHRAGLPSTLQLRHNEVVSFMGELLSVTISSDTVVVRRQPRDNASGTAAMARQNVVFTGSLAASSMIPYVPESSKLEKPDAQYVRSLIPQLRNGSGSGSGSNSNPGSGNSERPGQLPIP